MQVEQKCWSQQQGGWSQELGGLNRSALVLVFGSPGALRYGTALAELQNAYPDAALFGCSTAGEIVDTTVQDESIVATAIEFAEAGVEIVSGSVSDSTCSFETGRALSQRISHDGLVHVLVLSDGLHVNGSELVRGLQDGLPGQVSITGGLSADGDQFKETFVVANGSPASRSVALVGFYGSKLKVAYASLGGWDSFGSERLVTRSDGNVLYELDGRSALDLYKQYLGEHAAGLPATGLLFPLSIRQGQEDTPVVRTILGVNEENQSLTFAGDIPVGAYARLMKANFDRLIDGASDAAQVTRGSVADAPELALLVSCVGRRMVLKQRIEEEVEAVRDVLGADCTITGFYSYGEISPFTPNARCELHNQTMTITTLRETA